MATPISKTSLRNYVRFISRKNLRFTSRKSSFRISKGAINIQKSFNNTIVTVTDTQGQVVSWSSASTCGFRGPRRGTPFATQTTTANAISIVIDQGMQEADVKIKGPKSIYCKKRISKSRFKSLLVKEPLPIDAFTKAGHQLAKQIMISRAIERGKGSIKTNNN